MKTFNRISIASLLLFTASSAVATEKFEYEPNYGSGSCVYTYTDYTEAKSCLQYRAPAPEALQKVCNTIEEEGVYLRYLAVPCNDEEYYSKCVVAVDIDDDGVEDIEQVFFATHPGLNESCQGELYELQSELD